MARKKEIVCVRCDQTKPEAEFVNDRTRSSGKFPWCKPCVIETRRLKTEEDAKRPKVLAAEGERSCPACGTSLEGANRNRLYCCDKCKLRVRGWRLFGLEPHEYRELIASMNGKCPICQRNVKKWVIDHKHDTGETTGPVCSTCNTSLLAYSYHRIDIAERLVEFLKDPPVSRLFGERRYVGPENISQLDRMWGWSQVARRKAA